MGYDLIVGGFVVLSWFFFWCFLGSFADCGLDGDGSGVICRYLTQESLCIRAWDADARPAGLVNDLESGYF